MSWLEIASLSEGVLFTRSGQPAGGVTATIKNLDGTTATTATDDAGSSQAATSLTADANGTLPRYIQGGIYTIDVPALGVTGRQFHAVSGLVESGSTGWTSVKGPSYRAAGDGTTDDTTAVQAAITAVAAEGGTVYFPPGTYICGPLSIPADSENIQFIGAGRLVSTIKLKDGSDDDLLTVPVGPLPKFVNLEFDGNSDNNTSGHILLFEDKVGSDFQGSGEFVYCTFVNAPEDAMHVGLGRANGVLDGCRIGPSGHRGFHTEGGDWTIRGTQIGDSGDIGLYCQGDGLTWESSQVYRSAGAANMRLHNCYTIRMFGGSLDSADKLGLWITGDASSARGISVLGTTFFWNSMAGSGLHSDIKVENTVGGSFIGTTHFNLGGTNNPVKYLIETATSSNVGWYGAVFSANSYVTAQYNDVTDLLAFNAETFRSAVSMRTPKIFFDNDSTSDTLIDAFVSGEGFARLQVSAAGGIKLGGGGATQDVALSRSAADQLQLGTDDALLIGAATGSGKSFIQFFEQSADPSAPSANGARLFAKDNGSGKTQLCVRFPTGAVQVLVTEP